MNSTLPPTPPARRHGPVDWLVLALIVALCVFAGVMVVENDRQRIHEARQQALRVAEPQLRLLGQTLSQSLSVTNALAALVRNGHGQVPDFERIATELRASFPGIGALQLAPKGVIAVSVPLAGNEKAIGHDLLADPKRDKEAFLARETGKLTLAGPFNLIQGGVGAAGRMPVYLDGEDGRQTFWGFATALIRFPDILDAAQLPSLKAAGYDYLLWRLPPDRDDRQVIADSGAERLADPEDLVITVPNGTWHLNVAPTRGWQQPLLVARDAAVAALLVGLLALLANQLRRQPIVLAQKVEEATRQLAEREALLESMNQLASDWLWSQDAAFRFSSLSPGISRIIGRDPDFLLGKTCWDIPNTLDDAQWAAHRNILDIRMTFRDFEYGVVFAPGDVRYFALSGRPVFDAMGRFTGYRGTGKLITDRKLAEERIKELAYFDQLTRLPNRSLLHDRLDQAMTSGARTQVYGALMLIDMDNFKTINDTLGHDVGDDLLRQVAHRLLGCVRSEDTVARLGGDEFVVMLGHLDPSADRAARLAEGVAEKILGLLNQPYRLAGTRQDASPSIGITMFSGQRVSFEELMKQADLAMYRAKSEGRNRLRFFDPDMEAAVLRRTGLEKELRRAIDEDRLVLHYQPQIAEGGRITGAEALVRWHHPTRGLVPPGEFIGLAEESGLIVPLGQRVLDTACHSLAAWASQPALAELVLAVNVSVQQLREPDFVDQVLEALRRSGADPRRLKLELTESVSVERIDDVIRKMFVLKAHGIAFALDDFGTGYSSLAYLKRLPLDQLKIDQSFVRDVLVDPNDAAIARTVVALAHSLGLAVIAEGVETEAQRDFLASVGCYACQGYLFSRPLPRPEFEAFVRRTMPRRTVPAGAETP